MPRGGRARRRTPLLDETNLYNYYFTWQDQAAAIALGYGSLYNHSPAPCARYLKIFDAGAVEFAAVRDIDARHEITVDYTDDGRNPLWFPLQPSGLGGDRVHHRSGPS